MLPLRALIWLYPFFSWMLIRGREAVSDASLFLQLHDATFKHCALLRSESLYQLNAASPSKAAPLGGLSVRPPLAERNKGLVTSLGDSSPPMGSVRKDSLSGHCAFTRGTPPSMSRQSAQKDKENKS